MCAHIHTLHWIIFLFNVMACSSLTADSACLILDNQVISKHLVYGMLLQREDVKIVLVLIREKGDMIGMIKTFTA